ncbi:MAG: molybdenum cofactor guanylyltransferase [Nitrososphaerota archaeon]|nr:molybdenum cofactor guanylyltransferase [Candidatus Bathyarchaeota archaeon]MDW8194423.1 molybdenum cofactor guanylyltransferase [Nitrososphaerota archaeon]
MQSSAIILAGGTSARLGEDKSLVAIANKPLLKHVLQVVNSLVEEKIVVVHTDAQAERLRAVLDPDVRVVIDEFDQQTPIVGAASGFKEAKTEYTLLLACDMPLLSREVLAFLLDICIDRNAVIPRWPNGFIEPLHAVYKVKPAFEAAQQAIKEGLPTLRGMIERIRRVRYVSTMVLQQMDPELNSLFNINTTLDLKRAELIMKKRQINP